MKFSRFAAGALLVVGLAVGAAAVVYQTGQGSRVPLPVVDDATSVQTMTSGLSSIGRALHSREPLPTNRWWSPGIEEDWPSPLYAWPLAVRLDEHGATVAQPQPTVAGRAVVAEWPDPLQLGVPGVTLDFARAAAWGDWDVTWQIETTHNQPVYQVTLAEGSPFAFFNSATDMMELALPSGATATTLPCSDPCHAAVLIETAGQQRYVLAADERTQVTLAPDRLTLTFPAGPGLFTVAAVAAVSDPARYTALAVQPVPTTRAEYTVTRDSIDTTFSFGGRTLFGVLPHQALYLAEPAGERVGSFTTLRGTIDLYEGDSFTTSLPRPALLPSVPLPVTGVIEAGRLEQDIAAQVHRAAPADVYSAGKDLLRQAQLAALAQQAGSVNREAALQLARTTLHDWCTTGGPADARFFSYDSRRGGILASQPAFGSEHYNDHHFQYGYFIHAAGILARLDATIGDELGDCVGLLIDDIAAGRDNPSFPYLRHFDPYAGHSWAHGVLPLGDGNNQESTSEAVQAWYAIALWGATVGDEALGERGLWLMSQEMAAARVYWLNAHPEFDVLPADFDYPMISILWGGKVDYATFFSPSPAAIAGIQFFPVTPALFEYVDADTVDRLIRPQLGAGDDRLWQTSLALAGTPYGLAPAAADWAEPGALDPVYSPSFAAAWTAAWGALGPSDHAWQAQRSCGRVFTREARSTAVSYRFPGDETSCTFRHTGTGRLHTLHDLGPGWSVRPL